MKKDAVVIDENTKAQEIINKARQVRVEKCQAEIQTILAAHKCRFEISVILKAGQVIPQLQIVTTE